MRQKHFKDLQKRVVYLGIYRTLKPRWSKAPLLWHGGGWISGNPRFSDTRTKERRAAFASVEYPD